MAKPSNQVNKNDSMAKVLDLQELAMVDGGGKVEPDLYAWSTASNGCKSVGADEWSTLSNDCPR